MYDTIIFDIDGTLLDTEKAVLSSLQRLLSVDYGIELKQEELHFALGVPGSTSLPRLGITDVVRACERWNGFMREYHGTMRLFPGVPEMVERLISSGVMTGVVTSKNHEEYAVDFVPFGIADRMKHVVCADDTSRHKPFPDPLLKFFEKSGADPGRALYVGDTDYDRQCATEAGVDFALALWGTKTPELSAAHRLAAPKDILTLLKG